MSIPHDTVTVHFAVLEAVGYLTKTIRLKDGKLVKTAAVSPASGVFTALSRTGTPEEILGGAYGLKGILESLEPRQALMAGRLPLPSAPDGEPWRLRLKRMPEDGASLPRTKGTFKPPPGASLGFLDFDVPEPLRPHLRSPQELYDKVLLRVWNGFGRVALLIRPSVSSGAKVTGEAARVPSGFHAFFIASDGLRLGDLADALFARLALMGAAVVLPSRRGSRLRRALVDPLATKGAERLIFEADPIIASAGVERVPRDAEIFSGSILDVDEALATLAMRPEEEVELQRIWREADEKAAPQLAAKREAWLQERTTEIVSEQALPPEKARRVAERETALFEAGELRDDFPIPLDDGTVTTPYEILLDPDRFKGARGYSLDEEAPRPGVTFIWPYPIKPNLKEGKPAGPWLHTFEHGGRYFRLVSLRADVENHRAFIDRFFVNMEDLSNERPQ